MTTKGLNCTGCKLMLLACVALAFSLPPTILHAQDTSSLVSEMVQSSQTQNGVTVTVAVQKTVIAGEPAVLRIRVLNQSTHSILCDRDAQYPRYDIVAKKGENFEYNVEKLHFGLSNFNQDPRRNRFHTALMVLAPGKSSLAVVNLARCFDLSEPNTVQITVTVPYREILNTPATVPADFRAEAVTSPPVVFGMGLPTDDSTFGRNKQNFGDPYP